MHELVGMLEILNFTQALCVKFPQHTPTNTNPGLSTQLLGDCHPPVVPAITTIVGSRETGYLVFTSFNHSAGTRVVMVQQLFSSFTKYLPSTTFVPSDACL